MQYNFESELRPEVDHGPTGAPLGQIISDATLEAANQTEFELPVSGALNENTADVIGEPSADEVDMAADAIVGASLFDRPVSEGGDEAEEAAAEDDFSSRVAAPLREPQVTSDDPSDVDQRKLDEIQRALDERVRKRLHAEVLPKDLAAAASEGAGAGDPSHGDEPGTGRDRRSARHAARAIQTSRDAAAVVQDMTGLDDATAALAALEVVAGALVRRVTAREANDFISQLPSELREGLLDLPAGPDDDLTLETVEAELASRLSVDVERARALAPRVGMALRRLISAGEIRDLLSQLPREMRALIPDAVPHPTP